MQICKFSRNTVTEASQIHVMQSSNLWVRNRMTFLPLRGRASISRTAHSPIMLGYNGVCEQGEIHPSLAPPTLYIPHQSVLCSVVSHATEPAATIDARTSSVFVRVSLLIAVNKRRN